MCVLSLSHVLLFSSPWTVAGQAPLSMGLSWEEYWRGLPFPPPGDLLDPGIKPMSPLSPALAGSSLPLAPPGKPTYANGASIKTPKGLGVPRVSRLMNMWRYGGVGGVCLVRTWKPPDPFPTPCPMHLSHLTLLEFYPSIINWQSIK